MMYPAIDNPANCGIRAVIRFLYAKNVNAAEIHRELCATYGQNVMSEGYYKFRARWVPNMLTGAHKTQKWLRLL
jgi:hypothetical protein